MFPLGLGPAPASAAGERPAPPAPGAAGTPAVPPFGDSLKHLLGRWANDPVVEEAPPANPGDGKPRRAEDDAASGLIDPGLWMAAVIRPVVVEHPEAVGPEDPVSAAPEGSPHAAGAPVHHGKAGTTGLAWPAAPTGHGSTPPPEAAERLDAASDEAAGDDFQAPPIASGTEAGRARGPAQAPPSASPSTDEQRSLTPATRKQPPASRLATALEAAGRHEASAATPRATPAPMAASGARDEGTTTHGLVPGGRTTAFAPEAGPATGAPNTPAPTTIPTARAESPGSERPVDTSLDRASQVAVRNPRAEQVLRALAERRAPVESAEGHPPADGQAPPSPPVTSAVPAPPSARPTPATAPHASGEPHAGRAPESGVAFQRVPAPVWHAPEGEQSESFTADEAPVPPEGGRLPREARLARFDVPVARHAGPRHDAAPVDELPHIAQDTGDWALSAGTEPAGASTDTPRTGEPARPVVPHAALPTLAPPAGGSLRAEAAGPAAPMPADAELPDQIVQSLRLQLTHGGGEARVHLRPEYLGELTVRVVVENGVVTAHLEAEVPAVREWIERHEVSLRQALGEHGLTLDSLMVSDTAEGEEAAARDSRQSREEEPDEPRPRRRRQDDEEAPRFEVVV